MANIENTPYAERDKKKLAFASACIQAFLENRYGCHGAQKKMHFWSPGAQCSCATSKNLLNNLFQEIRMEKGTAIGARSPHTFQASLPYRYQTCVISIQPIRLCTDQEPHSLFFVSEDLFQPSSMYFRNTLYHSFKNPLCPCMEP